MLDSSGANKERSRSWKFLRPQVRTSAYLSSTGRTCQACVLRTKTPRATGKVVGEQGYQPPLPLPPPGVPLDERRVHTARILYRHPPSLATEPSPLFLLHSSAITQACRFRHETHARASQPCFAKTTRPSCHRTTTAGQHPPGATIYTTDLNTPVGVASYPGPET